MYDHQRRRRRRRTTNTEQPMLILLAVLFLMIVPNCVTETTKFSWPRARIPFEDDPRLTTDPDQAVALNNARMDLQVRTCVRLVPRKGERDYVYFTDLGPHIECWNMFEPFPPKGRILVNAGASCLEPMRRPHRPRRVFSDCDIEYVNHLYNCPRRRKPSPICPSGRLIMAKPMELRQQAAETTTEAMEAEEDEAEEEEEETETTTGSSTTTEAAEAEETEVSERTTKEVPESHEGTEGGTTEGMPEPEEETTTPMDVNAPNIETTMEPQTASTTAEAPVEPEVIDAAFGSTTTEFPEASTTMMTEAETQSETLPEETTQPSEITTTLPETTTTLPEATTSMMPMIMTTGTFGRRIWTTMTEAFPESTSAEPMLTTTILLPDPVTTVAFPDEPTPAATAPTEPPPLRPYPFMMTLITTTTTTTIAPPPPDWVRSVEESFQAAAANSGENNNEVGILETRSSSSTTTATMATTAVEPSTTMVDEIIPEEPPPFRPPPEPKPVVRPSGNSNSDEDEAEDRHRPMVVGVIQVPPGSGLRIREKTKVTRVVEKTKYIGPCGSACQYGGQLVRLYRSVNNQPSVMDHFYTTERLEQHLMASQGFVMEPSMGFLGRNQIDPNCSCIRPLYRLYSGFAKNHFLTTAEQEKSVAEGLLGYVFERVLGYCTREPGCGAYLPLYRFFSAVHNDHFYTSDQQEMHYYKTHTELTYAFEKIECYVWQHSSSSRGCPAVPVIVEEEEREEKASSRDQRSASGQEIKDRS